MDYLDSSSGSEDGIDNSATLAIDSDEEERQENEKILQMLKMRGDPPKSSQRKIMDFEAEMEAELDRRASFVENSGGMEHQRSLSRSSSSSSLHSIPGGSSKKPLTPSPSAIQGGDTSIAGGSVKVRKKVKFAENQVEMGPDAAAVSEDLKTYDQVYFDSDESEGDDDDSKKKRKNQKKVMSNDELFYDPNSDAADQAWMDKRRRKYYSPTAVTERKEKRQEGGANVISGNDANSSTSGPATTPTPIPLPKTDAILNCPACFSVLCLDCQRHELYAGQYRAMFVMNCKIDRGETLTVPVKNKKQKPRKMKNTADNVATSASDTFLPVRCAVCNSQVAVYDNEEVYHFFNCLASHS